MSLHPFSITDMIDEATADLRRQLAEVTAERDLLRFNCERTLAEIKPILTSEAVAAERERCSKICEGRANEMGAFGQLVAYNQLREAAAEIRKG